MPRRGDASSGCGLSSVSLFASRKSPAIRVANKLTFLQPMAREAVETGRLDQIAYRRASLSWEMTGAVALLAPLGAPFLMVPKP